MEKTALKYSSLDDLIWCVNKLDALGDIVSSLAFYDSECLGLKGQEIGAMISEYSNSIKSTFDGLWQPIDRVLQDGDTSLLSELKNDQKTIQKGFMGLHGSLRIAEEAVLKVDNFMNNDFKQLMDMSTYFGKVGRDIAQQLREGTKEKRAPAKAEDLAEAPNPDQERSDNLKELLHIKK